MTADIELLPLPEHTEAGEFTFDAHVFEHMDMVSYARANVAHATASKDAEIERLREEVEKWRRPCQEFLDKTEWVQHTGTVRELGHHRADILRERIQRAEARAERLAEALRGMILNSPGGHSCEDFHHYKSDMHMPGDDCPVQIRWNKAVTTAKVALRDHDQEARNG